MRRAVYMPAVALALAVGIFTGPALAQGWGEVDPWGQPVYAPDPYDQGYVEQDPYSSSYVEQDPYSSSYAPPAGVDVADYQVFYDQLSPYGDWLQTRYGWAWRPHSSIVGSDFRPYVTGGRWAYTDVGWVFNADWDWGWAVYHYGRWSHEPSFGWVWVPGTTWGPSWCDWRVSDGYVGWAPLPPGVTTVTYGPGSLYWAFAAVADFVAYDLPRYIIPRSHVHSIYYATRPHHVYRRWHGARYHVGPDHGWIERRVRRVIPTVRVSAPRPGVVRPIRVHRPVGHYRAPRVEYGPPIRRSQAVLGHQRSAPRPAARPAPSYTQPAPRYAPAPRYSPQPQHRPRQQQVAPAPRYAPPRQQVVVPPRQQVVVPPRQQHVAPAPRQRVAPAPQHRVAPPVRRVAPPSRQRIAPPAQQRFAPPRRIESSRPPRSVQRHEARPARDARPVARPASGPAVRPARSEVRREVRVVRPAPARRPDRDRNRR